MPPTRLGIRTPVAGDSPDIPRDIGNANADLDAILARLLASAMQAGRLDAASLAATAPGLMVVAVAAGQYFVMDDGLTYPELVPVYRATSSNINIAAANGTNPRIDSITIDTAGALAVLTGTATAGATLDNRNGATALPVDREILQDVLVPAGSTSVVIGNIRDRRAWARGALCIVDQRAGADYTTTSTTPVAIDATNLSRRIECAGGPVKVRLSIGNVSQSGSFPHFELWVDSVFSGRRVSGFGGAGVQAGVAYEFEVPGIAPGSHVFEMRWLANTAATLTLKRDATHPLTWRIEESIAVSGSN